MYGSVRHALYSSELLLSLFDINYSSGKWPLISFILSLPAFIAPFCMYSGGRKRDNTYLVTNLFPAGEKLSWKKNRCFYHTKTSPVHFVTGLLFPCSFKFVICLLGFFNILISDIFQNQNFPCIVPLEYSDGSNIRKHSSVVARSHPLIDTTKHFVLGDWFHASTNPHQSHLCKFHDLDLCLQANTIKTSIQESQNNRKNQRRLRSSTVQNFETHVTFNYLMDFYQNEEVVDRQQKILKQRLSEGQHLTRDNCLRFKIVSE